jgi:hypothetical protein
MKPSLKGVDDKHDVRRHFDLRLLAAAIATLAFNIYRYAKGLRDSPRDMWLLFLYKFVEYAAYAAMNMAIILWLSKDCGLGDVAAGTYISAGLSCFP